MKIGKLIADGGGEIELRDRRPGSRVTGDGGVKITDSQITAREIGPSRYEFVITGSAPKSLIISDLTTMLEARFRGELGMALTRSRDEAVQRLKERMDKQVDLLKREEEHYRNTAVAMDLEKKKYEKEADEIRQEVEQKVLGTAKQRRDAISQEVQNLEVRRLELHRKIDALNADLTSAEGRKAARATLEQQTLASVKVHPVSQQVYIPDEQLQELASNLIEGWHETLQDYEQPMASEYGELVEGLARTFQKLITRMNDAFGDKLRTQEEQEPANGQAEDPKSLF